MISTWVAGRKHFCVGCATEGVRAAVVAVVDHHNLAGLASALETRVACAHGGAIGRCQALGITVTNASLACIVTFTRNAVTMETILAFAGARGKTDFGAKSADITTAIA